MKKCSGRCWDLVFCCFKLGRLKELYIEIGLRFLGLDGYGIKGGDSAKLVEFLCSFPPMKI